MQLRPLVVVLVAVSVSQPTQSARHHARSPRFIQSASEFATLLAPKPFAKAHTAAVFILTVHSAPVVCDSLQTFYKNFVATNPADVFVFAVGSHSAATAAALRDECFAHLPNFYAIDMLAHAPQLGWQVPTHLRDRALWAGPWPASYRIMGHWRLTSQFYIARLLGYDYVLQVDDDSEFPHSVGERVIDRMEAQGLKLAGRAAFPESHEVAVGLPELAKYFLVTERVDPSPLLYQHCKPGNISGLFSDTKNVGIGWDRTMLYGNFVVYRTSFIFEPMVQRFIKLVVQSGGHFRYRWNEQTTFAMVWHLFVRDGEWALFDFPYKHGVVDSES